MKKGYRAEWKIKRLLEENGWLVVRSAGSIGYADLACFKNGKCYFLQVKSSKSKVVYYNGYMENNIHGFPFYVVVDFGYGKIKIFKPKEKLLFEEGEDLKKIL